MSSAVMAVQDDLGGNPSNTVLPKDAIGNNRAPKARKPYTITKQRERWTDEEHKRFLEALKLNRRDWRRIEEHVGTKTAVQIRSHAQKFFSKVVRESNGGDENLLKPADIPPPRPKRQAMRPYPRKLVTPVKIGIPLQEQQSYLASPNLSVVEQENRSPTSVLSAIGSDTITDSNMTNDGQSPVSSAADVISGGCIQSEPIILLQKNGYSFATQADGHSNSDEQVPPKPELFTKLDAFTEGRLADESSSQCLKLFGKTVIIPDSHKQSFSTLGTWQKLPSNSMPTKISARNSECAWSVPSVGAPAAVYYSPFLDNFNPVEAGSVVLPSWTPPEDASFLSIHLYNPIPSKLNPSSNCEGTCDNGIQKRGSLASSNTESPNSNGNRDVETNNYRSCLEKENEEGSTFPFNARDKIGLRERRASTDKFLKGFVPYKRCLAERDTQSSTIAGEVNEEKWICLCL